MGLIFIIKTTAAKYNLLVGKTKGNLPIFHMKLL